MEGHDQTPIAGAVMCIAKAPQVGRSKTRLCPPLTPNEACDVAWACLLDSLDVVAAVPAERHVLVLDGEEGPWIPEQFEVIRQRGDGLAERLAAAFTDVGTNAVVIAMDTPQVTDGGYWLIGLRSHSSPELVFRGVPMSEPTTGAAQLARLTSLGLSTVQFETLCDIDLFDDLMPVAASCDGSRLAALVRTFAGR
jgi:uncharacterized protein